jgi:hypothetical protein
MTSPIYESAADTARKVRQVLKAAFPGTKFSVTSKTYSGGSSIRVSWTDGPVAKQVEAITDQFASASFDGMQDLKTYNGGYCWRGTYYSGADWVHCSRELSPEREAMLLAKCAETFSDFDPNHYSRYRYMQRVEYELLGIPEYGYDFPRFEHLFEQEPQSAPVEKATYRLNDELGGVEIVFPGKPSADVLDLLKANRFRWHRKLKHWYAPQSENTLAIARQIATQA